MSSKKVVIIGAGIGGLAAAARLAAKGLAVRVVERNAHAGGKLGLLQQAGYTWDTGPSLFTQPYLLEQLFSDCGKDLRDYFSYTGLREGTQYFWEDGVSLHASPDKEELAVNIAAALHIAPDALLRYLQDAAGLYRSIGNMFLDEPIHRFRTWKAARILPALKALKPAYLFQSLHRYNARNLEHPRLVQMLDRMATYNGSDPYRCPAMLSMIAHLELNEGAWYPQGGMIRIPQALRRLCEDLGVAFTLNAQVQSIRFDGRARGIVADGQAIEADAVISNSDVYYTYRDLLGDSAAAQHISKQERSSSGIIFYWGIRKTFPQLRLHNVFFSNDYRAEFHDIFKHHKIGGDLTVYLNISSKQDRGHAPAGCENWFVLVNTSARSAPMDAAAIAQVRHAVLARLSRTLGEDIPALIFTESMLTPDGIERDSGSFMGALYGTASNTPMAAFRRHPNFSGKYPGLFFAGGTVHPGGGIPLCLRSGRLAADEVMRYLSAKNYCCAS